MRCLASVLVPSLLVVASISLAGCAVDTPADEKKAEVIGTNQESIVGGTQDDVNGATVLLYGGGYQCSGTLISVNGSYGYVLTAGHCSGMQLVQFGVDVNNPTDQFTIDQDVVDPMFNANDVGAGHDFRVVRFSGANASLPVVPAASNPDGLAQGQQIEISGYGIINGVNQTPSNVRRHVTVSIANLSGSLIEYSQTNGKGACEGDSGGPAYAMVGGVKKVVGVTSFGDQTCQQYGDSGRVELDYNWIASVIGGAVVETCDSCFNSAVASGGTCDGQVQACFANAGCSAMVDCINACPTGNQTCVNNCYTSAPAAAQNLYNAIYDCALCNACSMYCDQSQCGTTTSSVTSGVTTGSSMGQTTSAGSAAGGAGGAGGAADGAGGSSSSGGKKGHTTTVTTCAACTVGSSESGDSSLGLAALAAGLGIVVARRRR